MKKLKLVVSVVALATACKVGPDYEKPSPLPNDQPLPDAWHNAAVLGVSSGEADLQTWWTVLGDQTLEELLQRAALENLSLRQAIARIAEARAFVGVARGERMPVVDATGNVNVGQQSEATLPVVLPGATDATTLLSIGVDAAWEMDIFGKFARNIESTEAGFEGSVEDYRDVLVSLLAEVALAYVDVRAFQRRIELARANVEAQRESLQLTRDRFDAGLTSALDVAQAESNLGDTESTIPRLEQSLEFALNRLAVLVAVAPGSLHQDLAAGAGVPATPSSIAVGIPANVMRQRPDIRAAERFLAAQTAQIGVATADLYPRFSLRGFFTFNWGNVGDESTGTGWSLIPGFSWNLFDRGRIRARVQVEEARTQQAFLAYEQTVLVALEDVENAMVAYFKEQERRDRLTEAVDAAERSVELVRTQYLSGLTNFQNVLDSQRSLFRFQDQLAESEGLTVQNLILLYRSLGGGWDVDAQAVPAVTEDR
jgi:NodT family efflux transporter outer membrane factor (OMF) lipoprotein